VHGFGINFLRLKANKRNCCFMGASRCFWTSHWWKKRRSFITFPYVEKPWKRSKFKGHFKLSASAFREPIDNPNCEWMGGALKHDTEGERFRPNRGIEPIITQPAFRILLARLILGLAFLLFEGIWNDFYTTHNPFLEKQYSFFLWQKKFYQELEIKLIKRWGHLKTRA